MVVEGQWISVLLHQLYVVQVNCFKTERLGGFRKLCLFATTFYGYPTFSLTIVSYM